MFGYKYKKDALKWRAHQKKLEDAELAKTAKMVCKVHLKGGKVLKCVLHETGKKRWAWHNKYYVTYKAEELVNDKYNYICSRANSDGLHIDGSFYPHSQIKRIERGEIEVTENATQHSSDGD